MTTYVVSDAGWVPLGSSGLPSSGVTAGTYGDGTHVAQVTVSAAGVITAASNVGISGGGGGGGTEFDYQEITANVTTTAGPTTAITGASVTYDGATRVKIEVFAPALFVLANGLGIRVSLYDGAAVVADIGGLYINSGTTVSELDSPSLYAQRLLTPSAGAHQYIVKIYVAAGSGTVGLGAGTSGSGNFCPAFLRITSA